MDNIVTRAVNLAGGRGNLAVLHGVSYQAAWFWEKRGYFPLKQMQTVRKNFPEITADQLMSAYKKSTIELSQTTR